MPASKVPWSKGQDTGLSSRRYWVQGLRSASVGAKRGPLDHSTSWRSLWLLSLKVRTPASQAGDDGFEPRRSYCGYRTMVVRQIVALRRPKRSGDQRTVNPSQRNIAGSSPAPSTFRLRVREVYGATLLRWCAATHRRFESFRKRSKPYFSTIFYKRNCAIKFF